VQSWLVGGAKPWSGNALGSLEGWCRTLGGIFENVGRTEFLGNLEAFRAEADEETVAWRAFVDSWWAKYRDQEVTSGNLFEIALQHLDLGTSTQRSQQTRVGTQLVHQRDRRYGDLVIRRCGLVDGYRKWRLDEVKRT
jgi:hypothetical protein